MKSKVIFAVLYAILSFIFCPAFAQTYVALDIRELSNSTPIKRTIPFAEEVVVRIVGDSDEDASTEIDDYAFWLNNNTSEFDFPRGDKKEIEGYSYNLISLEETDSITIKKKLGDVKAILTFDKKQQNPQSVSSSNSQQTDTEEDEENLQGVGIPIYDAVLLKSLLSSTDQNAKGKFANILKLYNKDLEVIKSNPFFKDVLDSLDFPNSGGAGFRTLVANVGSTNVNTFVTGLNEFIIERATEELNVAFFNRFQTLFNKYPELKLFFPSTTEFLSGIDASMYASYLQALQASFNKDCIELSYHLTQLQTMKRMEIGSTNNKKKEYEKYNKRVEAYNTFFSKPIGAYLLTLLFAVDGLIKEKNPADIMLVLADSIDNRYELKKNSTKAVDTVEIKNYVNGLKLSKLISQSIRSKDSGSVYASDLNIKTVLNDETTFRYYLGLLYEQNNKDSIIFFSSKSNSTTGFKGILANYANTNSLSNPIQYIENIANSRPYQKIFQTARVCARHLQKWEEFVS